MKPTDRAQPTVMGYRCWATSRRPGRSGVLNFERFYRDALIEAIQLLDPDLSIDGISHRRRFGGSDEADQREDDGRSRPPTSPFRYSRTMDDRKPPRIAGDETATLGTLLQYQRDSFVRKVTGVSDTEASSSPVSSGISLLWLTNHMADAESNWVLRRFAQRPVIALLAHSAATVDDAVERYRKVCEEVDAVVADTTDLDLVCPLFDLDPPVNLRWILCHLLEETARHAGHADILRELIDGSTGR